MLRLRLVVLIAVLVTSLLSGGCNGRKNDGQKKTVNRPTVSRTEEDKNTETTRSPQPHFSLPDPLSPSTSYGQSKDLQPDDVQRLPLDNPLNKRWPRTIISAVLSPNGKTAAIYDGVGVYITDMQRKYVCRLHIILHQNLANESTAVSFAFRSDGQRVAIFTTQSFGEPMGAFIERLWTADVASGRVRRLSTWSDRLLGPGPITAHRKLGGWTKDGKSVIVTGTIYDSEYLPEDAREVGIERKEIMDAPSGS